MEKKLLYLANIRLPTEKAHGIQILKTCEALAAAGVRVELVVTNRKTPIAEDPYTYYGVAKTFAITRLVVWDTVSWGRLGFYLESILFAHRAVGVVRKRMGAVVLGRDELVLWWMPKDVVVVWEAHTGAWNRAAQAVAKRARTIVVITQGLKDFYVSKGVDAAKIVVAPDGVDIAQFELPEDKAAARTSLGLGPGALALYTGSRQAYKGTAVLEEAAKLLPQVQVLLVSGEPYARMPLFMRAADVLVLPNSGKVAVSRSFTSPMKLFEYMAAQKPIVAADLPSIREVLDESWAYFFTPDDPQSLAHTIEQALKDPEASARAARARVAAERYSWGARAKTLVATIWPD